MRCLARVPTFLQRKYCQCSGENEDTQLLDDVVAKYVELNQALKLTEEKYVQIQKSMADSPSPMLLVKLHAHYQRTYGICLAAGMILNFVVGLVDPNYPELRVEGTSLARESVALAAAAEAYRPLGASFVSICLYAAWVVTDDLSLRPQIAAALADYTTDFPWSLDSIPATAKLQRLERTLHS